LIEARTRATFVDNCIKTSVAREIECCSHLLILLKVLSSQTIP
jgi:hypothetical protein